MKKKEWFADWFDSPYYSLLYNHRNEVEANSFLEKLCRELKLPEGSRIWDNACGKGRHCFVLAKSNYLTTGTDLSKNSIQQAIQTACKNTEFYVHDMRSLFRTNYFDCVMNLFTSLGYFEKNTDNLKVFRVVNKALKPKGLFVIDFFNSTKVKKELIAEQVQKREGVDFYINKKITDGRINKTIKFEVDVQQHEHKEQVSLLSFSDFEQFAKESGFEILKQYGDYTLKAFDETTSERLILILKKIN